jgi:GNAT superfamily N-acetyltransferase
MILRDATEDERDTIVALIDTAFFDLPANQHLIPDTGERSAVMRRYFALHVDHALAHGTTHVAVHDGTVVGAALWYEGDDSGPAGYDQALLAAVGEQRAGRFRAFDNQLHQHTPTTDHAYLGFLAVAPDRQSHGIGSLLLQFQHHDLDRLHRPAYLVASSERSRELYLRHGYADTGHRLLELPNGGRMYRMWRTPRAHH